MLREPDQPIMLHRVEKGSNVGVQNPVHLRPSDCRRQRIQRIVPAAPRSKPVRKPQEVFFVDCIEHFHQRTLDDLVFQRSKAERALPPIRFGDLPYRLSGTDPACGCQKGMPLAIDTPHLAVLR